MFGGSQTIPYMSCTIISYIYTKRIIRVSIILAMCKVYTSMYAESHVHVWNVDIDNHNTETCKHADLVHGYHATGWARAMSTLLYKLEDECRDIGDFTGGLSM